MSLIVTTQVRILSTLIIAGAFLFLPAVLDAQPTLKQIIKVKGDGYYDGLGSNVLGLGDINKDGYPDVGVGARLNYYWTPGEFRIYFGGPGILDDKPDVILKGGKNAVMGDFNGDGYRDLVTVKPPLSNIPNFDTAFVYLGKPGPGLQIDTIPAVIIPGEEQDAEFGRYMAVGDLNRDGYDDLVISAICQTGGGKVYVFLGKPVLTDIPDFTGKPTELHDSQYGTEVQIADVNGDGHQDLLLGVKHYWMEKPWQDYYKLEIHHGGPGWTFRPEQPDQVLDSRRVPGVDSSGLNIDIARAIDVNGDGIADLCMRHNNSRDSLFVFYGRKGNISHTPDAYIIRKRFDFFFVYRPIHSVGDINGDGYDDFALRMGVYPQPYLVYHPGSAKGICDYPFALSVLYDSGDLYGENAASVGDVNDDGVSDVCAGSPVNNFAYFGAFHVLAGDRKLPVSVREQPPIADESFALGSCSPNPFGALTRFDLTLTRRQHVVVRVYDALGRLAATLLDAVMEPGTHTLRWDGKDNRGNDAPDGVYFYTAVGAFGSRTGKMIILRTN